jgi:LemA protein
MTAIIEFITGIIKLAVWLAIAVAAVALWGYNKLRACSENVKEALSNTVVVARKKIGLINQLMDVVRSYQGYEQFTTLKVSQDNSLSSLQQMYQESGTVLSTITGMAQRFPDLKANAQYHRLIDSIQSVEADLGNVRTRYNQKVKEFNVLRTSIPHVFYSHLLGFRAAEYFNEQAIESPDAGMQKAMISDDGERVNELLGRAGSAVAGAARNMAGHGRQVVKKGAARLNAVSTEQFHYLDAQRQPKGPVSRSDLDGLFMAGAVTGQTDVLRAGTTDWTTYNDINGPVERR